MSDDLKIYYPQTISDTPFPQEKVSDSSISQASSGGVYEPQTTKAKEFPRKRIAVETIGSALNTKSRKILAEFEFTESGSIKIGKYEAGISGDIRITPNGITARDKTGLTTFSLDGDTGDAVFKGTIQTGALIAGIVTVGNNNVIIDGENQRIIINDGEYDRVLIGYQKDGF